MKLIGMPALSKLRLKTFYRIGSWSVQIWKLNGHIFELEPFTEVGKFCSGEKFNFFFFLSNQNSNFISRMETELWRIFHLIGMLEWVCQIFRWRNFFPIFGRKKTESRQGHIVERLWVRSPVAVGQSDGRQLCRVFTLWIGLLLAALGRGLASTSLKTSVATINGSWRFLGCLN